MTNDPSIMGKPYLATEVDYLQLYRKKTWEEGDPSGTDSSEYSELQKPYQYDDTEPDEYSWWEWTWPPFPGLDPWGGYPNVPFTWPDFLL